MNTFACASKMAIRPRSRGHSGGMDMLLSMLGGKGMSGLFKTGTAILTILLVVPALLKIFIVTVDELSLIHI